jgi:hypothetical protein
MQRLPPAGWQRLLRSLTPLGFAPGEHVVRRGETADGFFVLTRGRAEVFCRGEQMAVLEPGDFFGEDALITGGRRNADVRLLTEGVVMHLGGKPFLEWLLAAALRWVAADAVPAAARELAAHPLPQLIAEDGATPLPLPASEVRARAGDLDPRGRYLAVGGAAGERALAAFVLTHRGFDVVVARDAGLQDPTGIRPAPCVLAPSP